MNIFNHLNPPKLITVLFTVLLTIVFLLPSACSRNPAGVDELNGDGRIMFIRNSRDFSQICTIKPDGTDLRVIASHDFSDEYVVQDYLYARWSPDKSRIVVEGGPRESIEWYPLWMMDMNGSLLYRLIWFGSRPVWSPDGKKIIYARRRGYFSLINDLYQIDADGGTEKILLEAETDTGSGYTYYAYDRFPNDRGEILLSETYIYHDSATGKLNVSDTELLAYDPDSKGKRYLTDNKVNNGYGRISPDGTRIIYTSTLPELYPHYLSDLLLMSAGGDSIRALTDGRQPASYFLGAWSPDGQMFAISDFRGSGWPEEEQGSDIYLVDLETSTWDTLTFGWGKGITNRVMDWK